MTTRVKRTAGHNFPGKASKSAAQEFITRVITEAARNMAAARFSEEEALELLRHLDYYTRVWGSATALACFRKLLPRAENVRPASREDAPHLRRNASPGMACECAGNEVRR